jgi:hypothetical protein
MKMTTEELQIEQLRNAAEAKAIYWCPGEFHGVRQWLEVGMCANKVTTTYHLIGAAVRGYVAQSTGRIGLSNKNNSESHCQGEQELRLGF